MLRNIEGVSMIFLVSHPFTLLTVSTCFCFHFSSSCLRTHVWISVTGLTDIQIKFMLMTSINGYFFILATGKASSPFSFFFFLCDRATVLLSDKHSKILG